MLLCNRMDVDAHRRASWVSSSAFKAVRWLSVFVRSCTCPPSHTLSRFTVVVSALRVVDCVLAEGSKVLFRIAIALFKANEKAFTRAGADIGELIQVPSMFLFVFFFSLLDSCVNAFAWCARPPCVRL